MPVTHPARRRRAVPVAIAGGLSAILCLGLAAPVSAAPADAITPKPDAFGRYFVDDKVWDTNTTANGTPEKNAAIALLTPMLDYWTPESTPTPEWAADGSFLPESVGTVTNHTVLDANIAEAARITQTRTPEQATAAYLVDRRNQNYSAIDGLGPWADAFRTGTNAGTTIPDEIPADATTVAYTDGGNSNKAWADTATEYGDMVALVNMFRNSSASTNPSKGYYNYARPFRWSDDVSVLPTLMPVKKADADALTDGGYPSGHTNAAWLASYALAYAAPERFQEILTNASEIGNSRIVAGMHSPADVIGGRMMSTAVAAAALNQPGNAALKEAAREDAAALLATPATGDDDYADRGSNEELYLERLTYGLPRVGDTTVPVAVPKGAEVLIESRLPYLDADERRWVLQSTGLPSGYALLDDDEGWGRLNLFAAADGYSAFYTDVTVEMDAAEGGFSAADTWRNDINGDGSLTKSGTGALTLTGANSFTGGTVLQGGSLTGTSATAFGTGSLTIEDGIAAETASGPVVIGGDFAIASAGELSLTIDAATPALDIAGTASFDGTVDITVSEGFVPADDQVIATFGDLGAGAAFDSVQVDGLPVGYTPTLEFRDGALHLVNSTPALGTLTAGTPTISGTPVAGQPLVVAPGAWAPSPVTLTYQWYRGADAIKDATSAQYTPVSADVAQTLSVTVTGTKAGYAAQTRTATATVPVVAGLTLSDSSVEAGERLTVSGAGFAPGETVCIELRSTPVEVGTAVAGPTGTFVASVVIPSSAAAGARTIVATGTQSTISASAALTVTALLAESPATGALAATGGTLPLVLAFTAFGLLALGGAFLAIRARGARSRRA